MQMYMDQITALSQCTSKIRNRFKWDTPQRHFHFAKPSTAKQNWSQFEAREKNILSRTGRTVRNIF